MGTELPGNAHHFRKAQRPLGSWITIKIGQDTLYQALLFPNRRNFNKDVDTAIAGVSEALSRRQLDKALLGTGDLAHDEF